MKNFESLLGELSELETLSKAVPAGDADGDAKIQAAAAGADGAAAGGEGAGDGEPKLDADGKPMAKSLTVTIDGVEQEAIDGTELVKALSDRIDGTDDVMAKALGSIGGFMKTMLEKQVAGEALIKSLQADIAKISGQGNGRKTVLTVHEPAKPAGVMAKSEDQGMGAEEFMAKALDAQQAGRITGHQVSIAEASLNRGVPVPAAIVNAVMK